LCSTNKVRIHSCQESAWLVFLRETSQAAEGASGANTAERSGKRTDKTLFLEALPHWREVPGHRSTASTEGATRRTIGFWLTFPANLSGKADSEGKRHGMCCGFSLPLEFL